jgi:hypothetical protein
MKIGEATSPHHSRSLPGLSPNQQGHAIQSIPFRTYSHWAPGMLRVTTAALSNEKNANKMQTGLLEN